MWQCSDKKAFTLAEVLITLGIIGIVAEITIPVLMQNVQDAQFKAAAKEAYSKVSQAIQQMKMDEGGTLVEVSQGCGTLKTNMMNYMKIAQNCNAQDCVPSTNLDSNGKTIYKTLAGYSADTADLGNDGQFITADGMFFNFQQGCPSGNNPAIIVVDVNGYIKKPNVFGKDTFAFQIINDNLSPMGANNTAAPASSYCQRTGSNNWQGIGCLSNVMSGIDY